MRSALPTRREDSSYRYRQVQGNPVVVFRLYPQATTRDRKTRDDCYPEIHGWQCARCDIAPVPGSLLSPCWHQNPELRSLLPLVLPPESPAPHAGKTAVWPDTAFHPPGIARRRQTCSLDPRTRATCQLPGTALFRL